MSEDKTLHKCCKLVYLFSKEKIADIFKVHGDIDYWDNTGENEPKHGWLMKEPTIPCDHLTPSGCKFVLDGEEKPERCQNFPTSPTELHLIKTCGFRFDEKGRRSGTCHRCRGIE